MTSAKLDPDSELAAAGECDLTQAATNSYTCQPEAADHQMTCALRSASRSPEASEPHLANGFFKTRVIVPGRSHQLESSRPPLWVSVTGISYRSHDQSVPISDVYPPLGAIGYFFKMAPSGMTPAS